MGTGTSDKIETIYKYKDGNATMRYGFDTYTEEEKNILKSDDHCLGYFYDFNEFTSKEDCFDSVILPSSKKAGLSVDILNLILDGTSKNIKSCYIFNKDVITNDYLNDK